MGMIKYYHALKRAGKSADDDQSEGLLSLESLLKKFKKVLDKQSTASYNKQAALREAVSRTLKIEQYRMLEWKPLKVLEKDHKQFQKVIQGRKRLCLRKQDLTLCK